MTLTPENLRLILGLKVKRLRSAREESLSDLAARSGLSISYLSEIENGRKYPKPEKLIGLARALGVPFEELVSPQLSGELDALKVLFDSDFIQEFPFEHFGLDPSDLVSLLSNDPARAAAFVQTFLEIGRSYDMQVEQFLFAALRSYQTLHGNYFPDLEEAASAYRASRGWRTSREAQVGLRRVLEEEHGYEIDEETLASDPDLEGFRSVYVDGERPRLLVNPRLVRSQKAFVYGREIGYREMGLGERPATSSWIQVDSFDKVLNNYRASYFAGALLIDGDAFVEALQAFFARERWDADAYLALMAGFDATPEMFAYRLLELGPGRLGLGKSIYSMRFYNRGGSGEYDLTKILNMSGIPVPRGVGLSEHYCRRWVTLRLLDQAARDPEAFAQDGNRPWIRGERARFVREDAEFFVISAAHPHPLRAGVNACTTLGFLLDDAFKETVRFWDDPAVGRWTVGLTCERCPLTAEECAVRAAPPVILDGEARVERQQEALRRLREGSGTAVG